MADKQADSAAQSDNTRERSTIEFPYLDLDDSMGIAKAVHTVGGTTCQKEQLAAQLQQSVTGGGFSLRLSTAKMYGLIAYDRGTIILTNLGIQACDPQQEKSARVEAFLNIPLYKALYEKYKGATLPPATGLESQMVALGVAPKQKDRARQTFQRSAKEAGFFDFGTDRLVLPAIQRGIEKKPTDQSKSGPERIEEAGRNLREPGSAYHPFIQGLLQSLPEANTPWSTDARKKWLQAAENIFGLIYSDLEAEKSSK
ncbi:MAG TPA: hypothetical protein VJO53_09170 [Candidatus Acidoferrales bacterium]|nr:hypothetical protein [Candidatus Acidoferrales bacterium]